MKTKKQKKALTLIEMIVVMLLIAIITGAVAYNYNESLNEGKAFKTKEGISRIQTILALELAENGTSLQELQEKWERIVSHSPLVANPKSFTKDGWNEPYIVSVQKGDENNDEIRVESKRLNEYNKRKGKK